MGAGVWGRRHGIQERKGIGLLGGSCKRGREGREGKDRSGSVRGHKRRYHKKR